MDDIDFSDGAMFGASPPPSRPPPLAPLAPPKPAPVTPPPAPVASVPRCAQCGFAYGIAFHDRNIYVRGRGWKMERFCSEACGANYQMGCEG